MADLQVQLEGLILKWTACKSQDEQKHSLIEDLFTCIADLSEKLSEANSELLDKKDVVKMTRSRVDELESQALALENEKARHVFAYVVIDGDCMPFRDDLVVEGLNGGKKAASLLKKAAEEEFKSSVPAAAHHIQVVVRVYANVKGLVKTYKELQILEEATFDDFVRGFNMGDALCDYVDAGNATFRLHWADVHCQQILFGGSADNGYARLLEPYLQDGMTLERITLLEGPPFATELATIEKSFRTTSFPGIFRSQKLPSIKHRVSFHVTQPATPFGDYATAAARTPSAPTSLPTAQESPVSFKVPVLSRVLRNKRGQRVDSELRYSQQDFANLKRRKLCNNYHLLGFCEYKDKYGSCMHEHGEKLSPDQLTALRAIARLSFCQTGLLCGDPNCTAGHRCTRASCTGQGCPFPREMHNVDTKLVG